MAGFARLGSWQYARMQEKEVLLAQVDRVLRDRRAVPLDSDLGASLAWVEGQARIAKETLLLDNQLRDGRPGVHVYCVAATGTTHRLVDFGWVAVKPDRTMPDVACPEGPLHVRGLATALPSAGVRMGPALQQIGPSRWLMVRADIEAVRDALRVELPPRVVRLDPAMKVGWARNLDVLPNTLPPERHLGYAVQWWALSAAVFVTALVLTFRKKKRAA
nr:SURF1 family protein [Lysobacter lactosilyticus]